MTGENRDPLELLGRHEEPDAEAMRRTIAASRAAFARRIMEQPARRDWRRWLRESGGRGWLIPTAAGLTVAAAVVLVALPAMWADLPSDGIEPTEVLAEAPPDTASEGTRMGARSLSRAPQIDVELPAGMQMVEGSELPLAYRLADGWLELQLLTHDGPRQIDAWPVPSGAEALVIAAFLAPATDSHPELLAVQIRLGPAPTTWHAYIREGTEIMRESEMSALLSDATDRGEAEERLRHME